MRDIDQFLIAADALLFTIMVAQLLRMRKLSGKLREADKLKLQPVRVNSK